MSSSADPLARPCLRPVAAEWVQRDSGPALTLKDPEGVSDLTVVIPANLAPLVTLLDGERDLGTLATAFQLRTGQSLPSQTVADVVEALDKALLLEGPHYQAAYDQALAHYRGGPHREPALAGQGYPANPRELSNLFDAYSCSADREPETDAVARGILSPHIDYARGGLVYGKVWSRLSAQNAPEIVVVLGTDHSGAEPAVTLTRQSYATPWGRIATDTGEIDALAIAIGKQRAFATELHHRREHSIELATTWLHWALKGKDFRMLPILLGSFHTLIETDSDPDSQECIRTTVQFLRDLARRKRTLFVAAADLAHVGPAFGDPQSWGPEEKADLERLDAELLLEIGRGDAQGLYDRVADSGDRYRVCGLAPLYVMLRALENARGTVHEYQQCPADDEKGSWVSIAGATLV